MEKWLDRIMYDAGILYLAIPVFIFLVGWTRPAVFIPVGAIFLVSLYFLLRNRPEEIAFHIGKKQIFLFAGCILILAVWLYFSGIGGFSFQNSDYTYRNAIFRDLIEKKWPVTYAFETSDATNLSGLNALPHHAMMVYYIAFWLPAALVGKLSGWYGANAFLYFWALAGLILVVYFLFRTLRRISIRSVLILIFFSGLDVLGFLWKTGGKLPGLTDHIEWWSKYYQYSSDTTLLYWVFNQTIVFWLAMLLLMNLKNSKSLFFMYSLLLLYGPFPFLGMCPFVLWKAYEGYPLSQKNTGKNPVSHFLLWLFSGVRRAVSIENIAGGITVLAIVYLYFQSNVTGGRKMGFNQIYSSLPHFLLFEAGLYLAFLCVVYVKKPIFWICAASFLLIPLYQVGVGQDFCMRVSIPALFAMQLMIQKELLGREKVSRPFLTRYDRKILAIMLTVMLVIGSVPPVEEMSRSIWYTTPYYEAGQNAMKSAGASLSGSDTPFLAELGDAWTAQTGKGRTWSDTLKSLDNAGVTATNFVGTTDGNFFYRYLARKE